MLTTGNATVDAIGRMNLTGNVVPVQWFKALKLESGKPDTIACVLLSEIVYWHRPTVERDESTGQVTGWRKKFKADKLQKHYQGLANEFGFTKRQVSDAIHRLAEKHQVITMEFRNFTTAEGLHLSNVLYLEVIPTALESITYDSVEPTLSLSSAIPLPPDSETYTETTTQTTSEEDADPSPSGDAVQPALIQTVSDPVEKESDTRKELELVLIDHFVEASRIERPIRRVKADYKADQTRWRKPIQVIAELVDWDTREAVRLLDATLERLLGGALTVSSPLSLVETARSIKGEWARGQPARVNGRQPQPISIGGGQRWG